MREALVQNAEHDIDRDQRRQKQQGLRADRSLVSLHIAGEVGMDDVGDVHLGDGLLECVGRVFDQRVGRQIVGDSHRRKLALMVDHQGRNAALVLGHGRQRHLRIAVPGHINMGEVGRVTLIMGVDFENDAVLIARTIDCRDLPLRKCVVERVVDVLDTHSETRGRLAIDRDIGLQSALFAVGRDIHDFRQLLYAIDHARDPLLQFVDVGAP